MKKLSLCLVVSFFLGAAYAEPDQRRMRDTTVRVACKTSQGWVHGTGFLVGQKGTHVLTNAHIVDECALEILVLASSKEGEIASPVGAKVIWNSWEAHGKRLDVALLSLERKIDRRGVDFSSSKTVVEGDPIWVMGFPGAADKVAASVSIASPTGSSGQVSRIIHQSSSDGKQSGVKLYQISAAINPGSSGGPLFNEFGEVVGINSLKALVNVVSVSRGTENSGVSVTRVAEGESIGWAQEIDEVLPILSRFKIEYRETLERRNRLLVWIDRDPMTAGAIGFMAFVMTIGTALLVCRVYWPQALSTASLRVAPAFRGAGSETRARTIGRTGKYRGATFPVQEKLVFGRDPAVCNVVFDANSLNISSKHCTLKFLPEGNVFLLEDHQSSNGTFTKDGRVRAGKGTVMSSGDFFYITSRENQFVVKSG